MTEDSHIYLVGKGAPSATEIVAGADGMKALLAYPGPDVNPGALCEQRLTVPEHPRLTTQEVQTWPL